MGVTSPTGKGWEYVDALAWRDLEIVIDRGHALDEDRAPRQHRPESWGCRYSCRQHLGQRPRRDRQLLVTSRRSGRREEVERNGSRVVQHGSSVPPIPTAGEPSSPYLGSLCMDLQNSFVVPADIDKAWQTLLDLELVAPCLPGAKLESVEGDTFTGTVKVKLGPVSMTYGGKAKFIEVDEANHKAVIEGVGKETRGSGTASALITTQMISEAPDRTRVEVTTDLTITGKPAQFGRGVMQDVAGRLIDQFAANLETVITSGGAQPETPAEGAPAGAAAPAAPRPMPHTADSIDLLGTAGAPVLKRAIPAVLGILALVGIIWLIARRKK